MIFFLNCNTNYSLSSEEDSNKINMAKPIIISKDNKDSIFQIKKRKKNYMVIEKD